MVLQEGLQQFGGFFRRSGRIGTHASTRQHGRGMALRPGTPHDERSKVRPPRPITWLEPKWSQIGHVSKTTHQNEGMI